MARVALVTGGSRGIGAAISIALKNAGYTVAANYAGNDEAAEAFKTETGISVYRFDVADFDQCAQSVAKIEMDLGPINILVNNAGITKDNLMLRMKDEDWDAVLDTNLKAAFVAIRAVQRGMMKRRHGRIIGITSVVGVTGNAGQTNYAASKAAVLALVSAASEEVKRDGVCVNAVLPSVIDTPANRAANPDAEPSAWVRPEEIGAVIAFLCSPAASAVTGAAIPVYGRA